MRVRSEATSVDQYLAELPADRRTAIAAVRTVVLANLPDGIVETMNWGMISYEIPLSTVPDTYNGKPLMFAALASQKQYCALYLMAVYGSDVVRREFEVAYQKSGKRMDIGKSCIRFRELDDLPLDVVADAVAAVSIDQYLQMQQHTETPRRSNKTKPVAK